jgi:hypothetical protein
MTVFDVFVNGRKLCRAGVGNDGVLNTIVSWVKLTGDAARTARRLKKPVEETRLHVGGLSQQIHRRWSERMLNVGDRVTVAVAESKTIDQPRSEQPQNAELQQQQERRYYLHLKRKFEGPPPRPSKDVRSVADESETRFLNVDVDIWSGSPLNGLADAFGQQVCVLHAGKEGRHYGAHLELATLPRDADRLIRRFVTLVERLPRSGRRSWDRARIRVFNVGIQAGTRPYSYELRLEPETLRAVAKVNARLGFTVYAPSATSEAKPSSSRKA